MQRKPNIRINEKSQEPTAGASVYVDAAGGSSHLGEQQGALSRPNNRRRRFQSPVGSPASSISDISDDEFLELQASQRTAAVKDAAINFEGILRLYWQIIKHSQDNSDFFNEAQINLIKDYNGNNNLYKIIYDPNPFDST